MTTAGEFFRQAVASKAGTVVTAFRQARGMEDESTAWGPQRTHTAPGPDNPATSVPFHEKAGVDPHSEVRVFRAAPRGHRGINPGDWVTTEAGYAHGHAERPDGTKWPVMTSIVPARHLWAGHNEDGLGYHGPSIEQPDFHHPQGHIVPGHAADRTNDGGSLEEPSMGEAEYSGTAIHLSPEDHSFIHDASQPVHERGARLREIAPTPFDWHKDSGDAHWDAYDKATKLPQQPHPPTQIIWHSHEHVPDRTGISWDLHNDDEDHEHDFTRDFTHHTFPEYGPSRRTAMRSATSFFQDALGEKILAQAAAETKDGIMVAFVPPHDAADKLAQHGTEPADQLHVTLAYLGKTADYRPDQLAQLPSVVSAWATRQAPTTVRIGGVGTFNNEAQQQHVLWGSADIPGGTHLHSSLEKHLNAHGYKTPSEHGWNPHLTLSYVTRHYRFMPRVPEVSWVADRVFVCVAGQWTPVILGGKP